LTLRLTWKTNVCLDRLDGPWEYVLRQGPIAVVSLMLRAFQIILAGLKLLLDVLLLLEKEKGALRKSGYARVDICIYSADIRTCRGSAVP
jgi:hypothetical protein